MSAFSNMVKNARTRNFGGTSTEVACEPYISGYGFVKWWIPQTINDYIKYMSNDVPPPHQNESAKDNIDASDFLSTQCLSVSPPNQSIEFNEWQCSAGSVFGNAKGVPSGHSLSIKYLELSGLPVFRIHKAWVEYIKDARTGLKVKMSKPGKPDVKDDYCGDVLYWTTKPDGITVEFAAMYSGVQPAKDALDNFGFDIGSIDKVELEYEYHVDYIWTDKWVFNKAKEFAKQIPYGQKTSWGGFVSKWGTGDVASKEKSIAQ